MAPQEAVPQLALVNLHYHVQGGPPEDESTRRRDHPAALPLLMIGAAASGAALASIPWNKLLGRRDGDAASGSRGRMGPLMALLERLGSTRMPDVGRVRSRREPEEGSKQQPRQGTGTTEPQSDKPPGDMLELIERERRRIAAAAAAEARANKDSPFAAEVPPEPVEMTGTALTVAATGLLTGHGDGEYKVVPPELRAEIAVVTEEVKVLQEVAHKADEARRAVLKEAEIAERAAKAACDAHANAKGELWQAEARLGELLEKASKKKRSSAVGGGNSCGSLSQEAEVSSESPAGEAKPVSSGDMQSALSLTPSYFS